MDIEIYQLIQQVAEMARQAAIDKAACDVIIGGEWRAKNVSYTSSEVKKRWIDANYKSYRVNLRYDNDQDLIDYIEQHKEQFGTTEIFRVALQLLIDRGGI